MVHLHCFISVALILCCSSGKLVKHSDPIEIWQRLSACLICLLTGSCWLSILKLRTPENLGGKVLCEFIHLWIIVATLWTYSNMILFWQNVSSPTVQACSSALIASVITTIWHNEWNLILAKTVATSAWVTHDTNLNLVAKPARRTAGPVTCGPAVTCGKFKFWLEIFEFLARKMRMHVGIRVYIYVCMHVNGCINMQICVCACSELYMYINSVQGHWETELQLYAYCSLHVCTTGCQDLRYLRAGPRGT
jgi:hypothetical protein